STRVPDTGEGTSTSTLSVVTSTSGSSRVTLSPACLSHLDTVPSVTDSPRAGSSTGTPGPGGCSGRPRSAGRRRPGCAGGGDGVAVAVFDAASSPAGLVGTSLLGAGLLGAGVLGADLPPSAAAAARLSPPPSADRATVPTSISAMGVPTA